MTAERDLDAATAHIITGLPLQRLVAMCEQAAQALSVRGNRGRSIQVRLRRVGTGRLDYAASAGRGLLGRVSVRFSAQGPCTMLWVTGSLAGPMHSELAARVRDADSSAQVISPQHQRSA